MSDLIDKEALYNYFADLEAVALEQVEKHMHDEDSTEWRRWSLILQERTAYKHDVFDAPTVDAEPVKHGKWVDGIEDFQGIRIMRCSVCGKVRPMAIFATNGFAHNYCANCGAKMDEKDDEVSHE